MPISEILYEGSIRLHAEVSDADEALRTVAELIAVSPEAAGRRPEELYKALKKREAIGSTAMGHGIAIPHCAIDGLNDFVVGLLTLKKPIDFGSTDGQPVDVLFFVAGPPEARNQHIKLLSALAKFASNSDALSSLRSSKDASELRKRLISSLEYEKDKPGKPKVLFQVHLQNLDYLEDILSLFSSVVHGSVSVVETRNAGTYMFAMPLFAAFWSDQNAREGRIVLAIVDKDRTNSVIRQIQEITGDPDTQTGVVVTASDLVYAAGTLDY